MEQDECMQDFCGPVNPGMRRENFGLQLWNFSLFLVEPEAACCPREEIVIYFLHTTPPSCQIVGFYTHCRAGK